MGVDKSEAIHKEQMLKKYIPEKLKTLIRSATVWSRSKPAVRKTLKYGKRLLITVTALVIIFFTLNWVFPIPDKIEYSTIITDSKGEVVHAYLTRDQKWRMKTELEEISPLLRKTIVE
ncbi:MAG TPA: hypothetical protein VGE79_00795, partial [Niastella sp.]